MEKTSKIYVAGHTGMVGSAIVRRLNFEGYTNIIFQKSSDLDLRNQQSVNDFFVREKPEFVFLAAGKVGGIIANNTFRSEFIYDNLMIESNIIHASHLNRVTKLLFFGSSCIYPKMAPQPLKESYLLSGYLEDTNRPYAIAKIAGIELCKAYRDQYGSNFVSLMPTNLYGSNDHYDLQNSHVLAAFLRKFIVAKRNKSPFVEIWGDGTPLREFMHVDDLASASLFLMKNYNDSEIINVGTGSDLTIMELAKMISRICNYSGEILTDKSKPNGTPRKLMDISKLTGIGWTYSIELEEGITRVYEEIKDHF